MTNNNNTIEKEINKIRIQLYEETRNLPIEELVKRANESSQRIAQKYNVNIVSKN